MALQAGKAKVHAKISKALVQQAMAGSLGHIRWWEMTRIGMSEKQETTVTEKPYVIETPSELTPDEWIDKHGSK